MEWFSLSEHMWSTLYDSLLCDHSLRHLHTHTAPLSYEPLLFRFENRQSQSVFLTRRRGAKRNSHGHFILTLLICQSKSQLTWTQANQECVFTRPAGCKLPRTQACYIQFYVISNNRERSVTTERDMHCDHFPSVAEESKWPTHSRKCQPPRFLNVFMKSAFTRCGGRGLYFKRETN